MLGLIKYLTNTYNLSPGAKGISFRLLEEFGLIKRNKIENEIKILDQKSRQELRKMGVKIGKYSIFFPATVKPKATELLISLWINYSKKNYNQNDIKLIRENLPKPGITSCTLNQNISHEIYKVLGYLVFGKMVIRADIIERLDKIIYNEIGKDKKDNPELQCESNPEDVKVGLHQIYCTEYCGDSHSRMLAKVVVLEQGDFELWVKAQNNFDAETAYAGDVTKLGEYYTSKGGCAGCHSVDGSPGTGPTWKGLYNKERQFADGSSALADDNYIRMSVLEPQKQVVAGYPPAGMPVNLHKAFGKGKEESGLAAIIEYIKTLN